MRFLSIFFALTSAIRFCGAEEFALTAAPRQFSPKNAEGVDPNSECFILDLTLDPVVAEGGDMQSVCGVLIGATKGSGVVADRNLAALTLDYREGQRRSLYAFYHHGKKLTAAQPNPLLAGWYDAKEYQHPNLYRILEKTGMRFRIAVWPEKSGSRVRLFANHFDRPVEEHFLKERITAGMINFFTMRGGQPGEPTRTSRFSDFNFKSVSEEKAKALPSFSEIVLGSLDLSRPELREVGAAFDVGTMDEAIAHFIRHMKSRTDPPGPSWDRVSTSVLHPEYRKISDAALKGEYGTLGYFDKFVPEWTDTNGDAHRFVLSENPLQINWAKDPGHLCRHFHWVSYAKTYDETKDPRYAKLFSGEVLDWVSREPFFWDACPTIGRLHMMDGTVFRRGYLNTGNIGRRLEMTWWPAYEVFRKSPNFTDEAHIAMLVGMIRQARLITNPTGFMVHDDSAAHMTIALLKTALLLPELKESAEWKALALARWDEIMEKQFHPDGSHVSLSTGYNWATIATMENFIRLMEQLGTKPPAESVARLEKALEHPVAISTPSQSMIPLNDGGWGFVDDHFSRSQHWFPQRQDFKWMATKGEEGVVPKMGSVYFPNAGQYVMRTGWGSGEKYLFFGAGPWGASHGKQDALNIFTQFGEHVLIRNAGRGSYSGVGNTVHAGRSLSYNTLSPDWAQENSIPHWKADMAVGFNPPTRRWIDNENFSYGEGAFTYGWYKKDGEYIAGKWLRQVIFVKGEAAKTNGYYVVIDTVDPADDSERTWRHPWQLQPDDIQIRQGNTSVVAKTNGAALQILPVDPVGDLGLSIIRGQTEPELLGWRVFGETAKKWPVPTHEWKAKGTFSRAWIIQMGEDENSWPVESVSAISGQELGEFSFEVNLKNGGVDHITRRFPTRENANDVLLESRDSEGEIGSKLLLNKGEKSVADFGK